MRWLGQHWLIWYSILTGIWVMLPWLAPIFMHVGATGPALAIYLFYSPQCHQLPQRSYFLFGPQLMVPLDQIFAVTHATDPLGLRWFLGTPDLGWKVAWSDRMVSLYTPLFLGTLWYAARKNQWRPVHWSWHLLLPYLPLLLDGLSHMLDDGLGLAFRADNTWLALLTGFGLPRSFYAGDALGSFNWWLRLLTGLLAGFAFVRQVYPYLDRGIAILARGERGEQPVHIS
jgi:hypothetical protein